MRQPISGGPAKKLKPMAAAKKPIRQVETSMSKKYKGTAKVSQTTIDNIKKLGMSAALKKAGSSKNAEYLEGVKRMYGAKRVASAQGAQSAKTKLGGLSARNKQGMAKAIGSAKMTNLPAKKSTPKVSPRSVVKSDTPREAPKRSMRNAEGMMGTRKGIKKYF